MPGRIFTTFLGKLSRDVRGNTLAIMAISLIPISALAGSAVDMARLYVVKSRLQQACDAGVLAGRKFMNDSNSGTLDATAVTRAKAFFGNNFKSGWMQTNTVDFRPSKTADSQVAGTATVVVPMTVMKMFKTPDVTVAVSCEARYDVADTDVMFVLDTTGSMACPPEMSNDDCANVYVANNPAVRYTRPGTDADALQGYLGTTSYAIPESTGSSGSRIKALRQAVKDFYSTMAANVDASTHIRYGFVPYTSTVNAGKAIYARSPDYLVGGRSGETWNYQSRKVTDDSLVSTGNWTAVNRTSSQCTGTVRSPAMGPNNTFTYTTAGEATITSYAWSLGRCYAQVRSYVPRWIYDSIAHDVSSFVSGIEVRDPTKFDGSTSRWEGCIEERATQAGTTTFTSASKDLDPNLIPTDDESRWKPMWSDVIYARQQSYNSRNRSWAFNGSTAAEYFTGTDGDAGEAPPWNTDARQASGFLTCGKPVHRLSEMTSSQIANYVDAADFKALGGTYHDVGMIWGTRMLSPGGIFASDTAAWPGRTAPNRVLVFLTDGNMSPNQNIYGLYGMEFFDKRVSGGDYGDLTDYHNARFVAECAKAKALGIDVWTVAIGMDTNTELTACASNSSQALWTKSGTGLSDTFKKIAKQVAMLRMSK